ncbi:hypothetical protein [Streptomyces sp. G45]|uniref:hypothetical protein n=1 Tax=Streptomyces sp. G45 TaxID=3406627 RepID=UPI003C28CDE0
MHGNGYVPPPPPAPSAGSPVTLRVLFVVLAVLTCGFLSWAAMLRLALLTRKARDWVLFVAVVALEVVAVVLIGIDQGEEEFAEPGNAGMTILVSLVVPVIAYYLTMDIGHHNKLQRQAAAHFQQSQFGQSQFGQTHFGGYAPPPPQAGYGYPAQPTPAPAPAPATPPPPTRPAPARIEQVRAELDELSDYLRKQEGGS